MRYTVVWTSKAQSQLAEIWLEAKNRSAMSLVADELDELLSWDPLTAGEALYQMTRLFVRAPLAIIFEVIPDDRLERVRAIRQLGN
jgi:hypothetical protein